MASLNDLCWRMIDAVHLGDFFDKYKLPPLLFPLLIILAILALMFLMSPGANPCGDGSCDEASETCSTCALDCGTCQEDGQKGFILTVEIKGTVSEPVTVTIYDKNDGRIDSASDRKSVFEFTGVTPQQVKAKVECSNGRQASSRPKEVNAENDVITVGLPDGCFEYITDDDNVPMQTDGNIVVSVYDAENGDPLEADVKALRVNDNGEEGSTFTEDGEGTLNVRGNNMYYLTASKSGFEGHNGNFESFYLVAGNTEYKTIHLNPLSSSDPASMQVCAFSGQNPMEGGRVSVSTVGGSEIDWALLTASSNGCVTFDVPAGEYLTASLTSPPAGCASPSVSNEVLTEPGEIRNVRLEVSCGQVAYVKVIVRNRQGEVMTDEARVTLWKAVGNDQIPGSAPDSSLSVGSAGYTEEVTVPANIMIQAKATDAPAGYIDTISGPGSFLPGEHGAIDIFLGEISRTDFEFPGASIIYTPAAPGMPVQIFVQQITYNETVLTPDNSDVVVIINGEEYEPTYQGQ